LFHVLCMNDTVGLSVSVYTCMLMRLDLAGCGHSVVLVEVKVTQAHGCSHTYPGYICEYIATSQVELHVNIL
jgi:hypothetical protein